MKTGKSRDSMKQIDYEDASATFWVIVLSDFYAVLSLLHLEAYV